MKTDGLPDILTPEECASRLRISRRTLARRSKGKKPAIPCIRMGRTYRYHWPTILALQSAKG